MYVTGNYGTFLSLEKYFVKLIFTMNLIAFLYFIIMRHIFLRNGHHSLSKTWVSVLTQFTVSSIKK